MTQTITQPAVRRDSSSPKGLSRSPGIPVGAGHWSTQAAAPQGFTLIEVMITVVIVAILATVAFPSYSNYIVRANRSAAQALMLDLANQEHQYFAANRAYATLTDLSFSMPADLSAKYTATMTPVTGPPPGFTITFTPVVGSIQAGDVTLTLDSTGNKTPAGKWSR
jgi:type IV pilus assembly protein PilE